jgi:predicted TIM-barrel fold metal-dependent hydrolase
MGSDYSHWDGSAPESIRMLLERTDLSEELKRKILSENPARLYRL